MQIELILIGSVREYEKNPRVIGDRAVQAVANSIKEFGFKVPVLIDAENVLIAGHTRLRAARSLGLTEVPAIRASDLSDAQVRSLRLADNQLATLTGWDEGLLPLELHDLKALGVDLSSLGFSTAELSEWLAPPANPGLVDADDVPETPDEPETQRGDIWTLGGHRILCGDSTDSADVDRLMDGHTASLCATDPPYLVDYTGERPDHDGGNTGGKDWSDSYREVEITDADSFFRGTFTNVLRVLEPNAAIYCWHAHKRQALIARVWDDLGILDHQQIVWVKPSPVFGRVFWHFRHEPCMMGWRQGSMPEHDSNHEFNSVWEIDWEGKSRVVGNEHPTQKPVEIFARPMRKHTKPGDVVFEPFSGSGSQIIAAEQQGRRCRAMELEPRFVEVAVRRWEKFTGKKAVRSAA